MVIDPEGEGLQLLRAAHAQASKGRWVELAARSAGAREEATAALQSGATVAIDMEELSSQALDSMHAICAAAGNLPRAAPARLLFYTRCAP